jgi:hypothetical protein
LQRRESQPAGRPELNAARRIPGRAPEVPRGIHRAVPQPGGLPVAAVLHLQRTAGNGATVALAKRIRIQRAGPEP